MADLISGEVLEALKEGSGAAGGGVQTNGGLIVTFLLDDTSAPIIAPDVSLRMLLRAPLS